MSPHTVLVQDELQGVSGRVVSWRLDRSTVDHQRMVDAWVAAGLPRSLVPATPEPETALRRAMSELRKPHLLIKLHQGVYVLSDERVRKEGVDYASDVSYTPHTTVRLTKVGSIKVDPHQDDIFRKVNDAYLASLGELASTDFTAWLAKVLVPYCGGVSLRGGGGFYFIPRANVPTWMQIRNAIKAASAHKIYAIPAMQSDECVEQVLDAIEAEAASEATALEEKLFPDEAGKAPPDLGIRALASLGDTAKAIEGKVQRYESMLGTKLTSFAEKLAAIRQALTVATLKAEHARQQAAVQK